MRNDPFGGTQPPRTVQPASVLTSRGYSVKLNMPPQTEQRFQAGSGEEVVQGLPPYAHVGAYQSKDCEHWPDGWLGDDPNRSLASYLVIGKPKHGLWFDFRDNEYGNDHYVAVVVSIQGVNALTARPVEGFGLEQYQHRCPIHDKSFGANRHCADCGYNWPGQNYLTNARAPGASAQPFWRDGFLTAQGEIRQFIFTEDESAGIAAQVIGDNRSSAIGFTFYRSKEPKPVPKVMTRGGGDVMRGGYSRGLGTESFSKGLEIGAGAKIHQELQVDPNRLDFWETDPAAVICLYYGFADTVRAIVGQGVIPHPEGPLAGLKVGPGSPYQS